MTGSAKAGALDETVNMFSVRKTNCGNYSPMLKEIAIADAYGAGFEFSSYEKVRGGNDLSRYLAHDLYGTLGKYTDDTQMSVALSELLLLDGPWGREKIAQKFVECFQRDKRKGYSKGFYDLLSSVTSGQELLNRIRPVSDRNGAAMRSVPLGILKDKAQVVRVAKEQAAVTHNTEIAIQSSCAVALAAHFGLRLKGELCDLKTFLERHGFGCWNFGWDGEVTVKAYDTVSAALTCLMRNVSIPDLLVRSVALCGDTDSVASIAVGLATCFEEYEKNFPVNLVEDLDESVYGFEYLDTLEQRLCVKYDLIL